MGAIVGTIASLVVGAVVATATVIGVVNASTGPGDTSPADVNNPVVSYGSTN